MRPRPVIWKPRYATRVMRERAYARVDLERERSAREGSVARDSVLKRLLRRFR
jgi:hypothetical protein